MITYQRSNDVMLDTDLTHARSNGRTVRLRRLERPAHAECSFHVHEDRPIGRAPTLNAAYTAVKRGVYARVMQAPPLTVN